MRALRFGKSYHKEAKPRRYWCGHCRQQFNAWTNTPLEYGKVKLNKWIFAAYLLMTTRKGISSLQLSKELNTRQDTAWYMLHRLRLACGPGMKAMRGNIEIDEFYLGGSEKNRHAKKRGPLWSAQGGSGKQVILGMQQRGGQTLAFPIDNREKETLYDAVHAHVLPGSMIYTDDNRSYEGVARRHRTVNHSAKEYVDGMAHTNGIELVWSVLKRGFNGTYHHWSKKHCRAYVNEFAFRLNEGSCERDTQDRLDDLFRGMVGKKITYKELTA